MEEDEGLTGADPGVGECVHALLTVPARRL